MYEVTVDPVDLGELNKLIGPDRSETLAAAAGRVRANLDDRTVWNVNTTSNGGGVAEMLAMLVPYARALGARARWAIVEGDSEFFRITKRLHHRLHGSPGDGGELGEGERRHYDRVLAANAANLLELLTPGDVVILHDPQTAGLAPVLTARGYPCAWRCHIGADVRSSLIDEGWSFLRADIETCQVAVFSRRAYIPPWVAPDRARVTMPCIDPLAAKNRPLPDAAAHDVLRWIGLAGGSVPGAVEVPRPDGSHLTLQHHAEVLADAPPPPPDAPMVVQVSRWDPLKDMVGVLEGFARHVGTRVGGDAHLALVGPQTDGVSDDPEGGEVWRRCRVAWEGLAPAARSRIRLVALPTADREENAVMVAAIQQRAAVVCQKSLVEGFGLTVAEAMWKRRPVVASAVGGIADQIVDGRDGLLVHDPRDLQTFGDAVAGLLEQPELASRLGEAARERVRTTFLPDRNLLQWGEAVTALGRHVARP